MVLILKITIVAFFEKIDFVHWNIERFDEFQYFTGLTTIPTDAFRNCYNLKSTIIPANISKIGQRAFYGCSSLESITLPSNISIIEDQAFENCHALKSVKWDANGAALTKLGNLVFKDTALTTLFIPEGSNLSIGYGIVAGCDKLQSFTGSYLFNDGNVLCKDNFVKGVTVNAFDKEGKLIIDNSWVNINGGIDGYLFYNNKLIKTLDFSNCKYNLYFKTHAFDGSTISSILPPEGYSIHLEQYSLQIRKIYRN